jgi:two-component system, NtrC family, sensor histidine kinase HydH
MLTEPHLTPDHAERIGRNIHKALRRMRELLSDLVCLTQGGSAVPENSVLLDLPERIEMTVVRTPVERVFINLVTNALEAMSGGGMIRIAARKAGDCALIEVEDSGPGIAPEIYGRLFDPFVTAGKKDGLGLGLALSRRTVRDHGGDMWIEPAGGARFVIRMPLTRSVGGVQRRPRPKGSTTSIPPM